MTGISVHVLNDTAKVLQLAQRLYAWIPWNRLTLAKVAAGLATRGEEGLRRCYTSLLADSLPLKSR